MAVVNSLAIGKSRKSAGNLTYKTVRGRTIASQRITENTSNTILQQQVRNGFKTKILAMQLYLNWVNQFFEKSKYGSSRNNFMKLNRFTAAGLAGEIKEGLVTLGEGFIMSFGRTEEGSLMPWGIDYASYGSLPAIVRESTQEQTLTFSEAEVKVKANTSAQFIFTTGIKLSDMKLKAYTFSLKEAMSLAGVVPVYREYTTSTEDISSLEKLGYKVDIVSDNDIISSVTITAIVASGSDTVADSFGVLVPSVGGKVPTMNNVFVVQGAGPLP